MFSWIIIVAGLISAFYFTDLSAQSALYSAVCPFLILFFATALLVKILSARRPNNGRRYDGTDGGWFGGDADGGGDGGGGGD